MTAAKRPRVLLIIAGEYHDFEFVRRELLGLLAEDDRIRTTCTHNFDDVEALNTADFLITYNANIFPTPDQLQVMRDRIEAGGKWLAIHVSGAYTCFKPPALEWNGIKLPGLTDTPDHQPDYMNLLGTRFISHLAQQPFTVRPVSDHPLVAGIPPFEVVDEPYIVELRSPNTEVLLSSNYTGEAPGYVEGPWLVDDPRPQMVLRRYGAGEALFLAPGHACGRFDLQPFIQELPVQPGPWISEGYREVVRRAIRWGTGQEIIKTA